MGLVLTQIATMHAMGFRHFEIYQGMTGPVGSLLYPRTQSPFSWGARPADIRRY